MRKILEVLGLHALTNREALMEELAAMDDRDLFRLMTNDYDSSLMDRLCHACKARHGGDCPVGMDDCLLWDGHWLREGWDGKPILEGGKAV